MDKSSSKTGSSPRKVGRPPKHPRTETNKEEDTSDDEASQQVAEPPPEPLDPEVSLDGLRRAAMPTTVHWDPNGVDGRKIGWMIRVNIPSEDQWLDGRIILYDPYSHKHKIELETGESIWIWIRNEQHNLRLATRLVWARVKGYPWWPAMVMESNSAEDHREGHVTVEFFTSREISHLRDTDESIRPFSPDEVDTVVEKHKRKRSAKAFEDACEEVNIIEQTRNEAAVYYATKAIGMANRQGNDLVGKRIEVFRDDVNYPYGDTVTGRVRQYSVHQKKWLVSFEISDKTKKKYPAYWIDLDSKTAKLKILSKKKASYSEEELLPYLFGFSAEAKTDTEVVSEDDRDTILALLQKERCKGCLEYWEKDDVIIQCMECQSSTHLSCCDPPLSLETWQKMIKEGKQFICTRCTPCRGCFQRDIVFGSHLRQPPRSLSLPSSDSLCLCSMCQEAYIDQRYCPNCAHTWDDVKFDKIRRQIEWSGPRRGRKPAREKAVIQDSSPDMVLGSFTGDEERPFGTKIDPCWYHPETPEWGFTEVEMLVCDSCKVWVHAGCADIGEDEYNDISDGNHPIYSKEFLCRVCCRKRAKDLIAQMQLQDRTLLFAAPVTDKVAPNYHDVIKQPMDLQTMLERADTQEYFNYAWVREMFELMVLNALTFNRPPSRVWNEAQRYYNDCLKHIFSSMGKGAPPGQYADAIQSNFKSGKLAVKKEQQRVQVDESIEKKDLVSGSSMATKVTLPKLRDSVPDPETCVPCTEVKLSKVDGFYTCWMDSCFTCGSTGASDTFLFCIDCGEAYHSFCASSPIHSMSVASVSGWRCPNCKVCEISGEVPQDETRMIYCEMCDRAFCFDLLDPPLQEAPPGLWICGQCVDCKVCGNTKGSNIRYWSQDPLKCFECGGCQGLALDGVHCCPVCDKYLHLDEERISSCSKCSTQVHAVCDPEAEDDFLAREMASRSQKAKKEKVDTYVCPNCRGVDRIMKIDGNDHVLVDLVDKQIEDVIRGGLIEMDGSMELDEVRSKLTEQVEWAKRDQWRQEYLSIIRESIKMCVAARSKYGDPRLVVQESLKENVLPQYINQRAQRFLVIAKRYNWVSNDIDKEPITKLVAFAKLASAFLKVAGSMGVEHGPASVDQRLQNLLVCPDEKAGIISLPKDRMRALDDPVPVKSQPPRSVPEQYVCAPTEDYRIASPLCGWTGDRVSSTGIQKWHDSRQCCLCHLRGDDDAGLTGDEKIGSSEEEECIPKLGRLLPMHNGLWVHTNCAIWSSEVYEAHSDNLVHAVERARTRGSQLKCFGCGRNGATVGCNKPNCLMNYHYSCARLCGAVLAEKQHIFCTSHKSDAAGLIQHHNGEPMKTLIIAPEKKIQAEKDSGDSEDDELCTRVGALVVHSFGQIESKLDGFHSENHITPPGYFATRIFWSAKEAKKRVLYFLQIKKSSTDKILFSVIPSDDMSQEISGNSSTSVYNSLVDQVLTINQTSFSDGDHLSKLPVFRKVRKKAFGLNGPQFFGYGLKEIRRRLEISPNVEAVVAPLTDSSPKYKFCFVQPSIDSILDLQRRRAASQAEEALKNTTGCARTEGTSAIARSGGSGRITRALVRSVEEDVLEGSNTNNYSKNDEKTAAESLHVQSKYRVMKSIDIDTRLAARRSHIHGWGLFTKIDIEKDDPIVEYVGEIIRQPIADKREKEYEISGEGSCYMFRLDWNRIVDATNIGSMARFMNHSCQNNAYAKIISVDVDGTQEKKIVVFACRKINAGEEITYDYKFPVEDGSLKCTCGAPNCIGRLN